MVANSNSINYQLVLISSSLFGMQFPRARINNNKSNQRKIRDVYKIVFWQLLKGGFKKKNNKNKNSPNIPTNFYIIYEIVVISVLNSNSEL